MCNESKGRQIECYIALTIEKKLKAYSECADHTERHEILWHEWNHNKRWLVQLQELILPSFPSYSRHDVSHSEAVIHNIEMLLGEKNIMELSATDCFVLLHTVYIHDIGMCITHADREEILANSRFRDYIENLARETDSELGNYARVLLQECFESPDSTDKNYVLKKKLEVYYAIIYLIAEHRRREHGDVSAQRLTNWIDAPDKLGIGFSTIDIPSRLFYIIANCAATHTKWDFNEVLNLKQEDSGFALDYVHPRFVAVLLQLGDALDMDNNRFHPLTEEFLGRIPEQSTVHWNKHKAIKRLRITNEKISISADCKNQEELRVVRSECDGIEDILKSATFYWSVIRPKESNVCLPTLDKVELLLQGRAISKDLVKAQFEIPQEKAFNLLMGNNIYNDHNFVFLRELIQNAVDATKLQYFRDYQRRLRTSTGRKIKHSIDEKNRAVAAGTDAKANINVDFDVSMLSPSDIGKILTPLEYPVEIELAVKKKCVIAENVEYRDISEQDMENPQKEGCEYGVLVRVRDYGIGIDQNDIERISRIGSSYEAKKEEIKKMPRWLQPTGTFGIGLQSVFLVGKVLTAYTHARNSDPYEIRFYPRQGDKRGYINVMPIADDGMEPNGSCFEVFVPYQKKKRHRDNPETWDGSDPFKENYENTKAVRHSRELLKQMALYMAEIVGEPLFPVNLDIYDCEAEEAVESYYNNEFFESFQHMDVYVYSRDGERFEKEKKKVDNKNEDAKDEQQQNVTWAYNFSRSEDTYIDEITKDCYYLDCENGKLYLWNQKYSTYACIGIDRILRIRDLINSPDTCWNKKDGVDIYYKGILLTTTKFEEDANLIEYIDIKDTIAKEDLKLNRNGFSKKGYEYLKCIYREILKTARKALKYYGEKGRKSVEKIKARILKMIQMPDECRECKPKESDTDAEDGTKNAELKKVKAKVKSELLPKLKENDKAQELDQMLLSVAALVYFSMVDEQGETAFKSTSSGSDNEWKLLLNEIIDKNIWKALSGLTDSTLYNIPFAPDGTSDNGLVSIFEVIDSRNKYMIVAKRDAVGGWKQKLVRSDRCHDKIKEKIQRLRIENSIDERKKLMSDIENEMSKITSKWEPGENRWVQETKNNDPQKEQLILKWLLDNIPTMALFSSADGNFRINLLDVEVCDSVYYSSEMKSLLIDKMLKTKLAERFTVPVISGFSILSLRERRESILFVKRGKLSKVGYGELIFPLTREQLEKELSQGSEMYKKLKKHEDDIHTVLKETLYKAGQYLADVGINYWNRFLKEIKDAVEKSDREQCCEYQEYDSDILQQMAKACADAAEDIIWEKRLQPAVDYLLEKSSDKVYTELENEFAEYLYQKYCVNSTEFTNINKYIQEHGKLEPSAELINCAYQKYMYEIAPVMLAKMKKKLDVEYEKNQNSQIVKGIKDAFSNIL